MFKSIMLCLLLILAMAPVVVAQVVTPDSPSEPVRETSGLPLFSFELELGRLNGDGSGPPWNFPGCDWYHFTCSDGSSHTCCGTYEGCQDQCVALCDEPCLGGV